MRKKTEYNTLILKTSVMNLFMTDRAQFVK